MSDALGCDCGAEVVQEEIPPGLLKPTVRMFKVTVRHSETCQLLYTEAMVGYPPSASGPTMLSEVGYHDCTIRPRHRFARLHRVLEILDSAGASLLRRPR